MHIESMHFAFMTFDDRPEPAKRLQIARESRGFATPKEASRFFGWSYETYIQHEQGTRGITRAAGKYAKAFRVSEGWLLTGEGISPTGAIESTVGPAVARSGATPPFAGYVRAGLFETFDPDFQQDYVPVPDFVQVQPGYGRIRQYAYQARGDSMNLEGIEDGMWIVAADASDFIDLNGDLETGDIVVVERTKMQRAEREMTLKQVHFFRDRYELRPRSSNPEHKPIVVKHNHNVDADGIEVRIVGILLTAYRDFRRKRSRNGGAA